MKDSLFGIQGKNLFNGFKQKTTTFEFLKNKKNQLTFGLGQSLEKCPFYLHRKHSKSFWEQKTEICPVSPHLKHLSSLLLQFSNV